MNSPRWRAIGLAVCLSNLLLLVVMKYSGLWLQSNVNSGFTVSASTGTSFLALALPLGISFFTFNLLGYSFDVYQQRIQPASSLLAFATYIMFFPTLISGPLVRYANFSKQEQTSGLDASELEQGIFCFCMGLAKKVIMADTFATIANPLFSRYTELGFVTAWLAVIAFSYQLYFDFSGYTDMAIGVGHLLGFKLPQNFNSPYAAGSITDFWQRWHITLSTW